MYTFVLWSNVLGWRAVAGEGGCLSLKQHVRYQDDVNDTFYPFLTIFRRAHAPIIISSFLRRFRGSSESSRENIPTEDLLVWLGEEAESFDCSPFRVRLLINICIFFFFPSPRLRWKCVMKGGMCGGECVIKEKKAELRCMWQVRNLHTLRSLGACAWRQRQFAIKDSPTVELKLPFYANA